METWDLYDENRQLLNETMTRGNEVPANRYHLVIHVCIINKQGQLLIQKEEMTNKDGQVSGTSQQEVVLFKVILIEMQQNVKHMKN